MGLENKELPRVRRGGPVQGSPGGSAALSAQNPGSARSSSAPDAAPRISIEFQEIPVLTFKEGGSSLDQRRITSDAEGHLKDLSPEGDIFEILYPDRGIILGFTLNREENWYDLDFAVDENTGERTSLAVTGPRPHLMIDYQAVFPFGETRIQMDRTLRQPEPPPGAGDGEALRFSPPDSPPPDPFPGTVPAVTEIPPETADTFPVEQFPDPPEEGTEIADLGTGDGDFYLEEAPPTPWEDGGEEGLYLGEGETPEVAVVFLSEKESAPAFDTARPVVEPETAAPFDPAGKTFSGAGNRYIIQVGAFRERRNAAAAFAALERAGFHPLYEPHLGLTRVLIPAVERGDLPRIREELKALGLGEPYVRQ
jgi:hypothetical protein